MWLVVQCFLCEISAWEFGILAAQTNKDLSKGRAEHKQQHPWLTTIRYKFEQIQIWADKNFWYLSESDQKWQNFQYTSDTPRCVQGRSVACLAGNSWHLTVNTNSIYKHNYMYIKYRNQYLANFDSISRIFLCSIGQPQYAGLSALSSLVSAGAPWTF